MLTLTPHNLQLKKHPPKKTKPSPLELHRQYLLEVQSTVAAKDQKAFVEQGVPILENVLPQVKLLLKASMWRTCTGPIRIVNYWDLGNDADTLLDAELALPDVPQFNQFNALIATEDKALTIPIAQAQSVPLPPRKRGQKKLSASYRYLRVSLEVTAVLLAEFCARVDGYMETFTKQLGWALGTTYYALTGRSGTVAQIWVIPTKSLRAVALALDQAPWLRSDVINRPYTFEVLRATPADPNLDPSTDPI